MSGSFSRVAAVHSMAASLFGTIRLSRALAEAGRSVDMTGLDGHVGFLCAKVLDLDPEDGRHFCSVLLDLINEIDGLAAALRNRFAPSAP